jgi:multidrug efflux pump
LFSRFFIDRPIFASVMSIIITLAGGIAFFTLPMAQYPQITPPTIQVDCNYPGANAQTVSDNIAAPIEQQVNGVENMMYMTSQCTSDGSYTMTATFRLGVDLNEAQVMVLNRVNLAMAQLPDVVQATGVTTRKRSSEILMTISIYSPDRYRINSDTIDKLRKAEAPAAVIDKLAGLANREFAEQEQFLAALREALGDADLEAWREPLLKYGCYLRYDQVYLSNYALMHLREEIQRLPGISDVLLFGQRDYSMRIWVDPELLAARGLSAADVVTALQEQNIQVAAGQVGQPPIAKGQPTQMTLSVLGRLSTPEQFEQVIVKKDDQGRVVRIKDIGRVVLGPKNQDVSNRFDGKPTVGLAVFTLADANALETADLIKAKMKEMSKDFPEGVTYEVGYDTTPFIRESVIEVFKTLRDAVILVAIVVMVFLQSWRSAIIPLVAVPVAIIGTFAAMAAVGFSLNNLTLFGLVLAIGIVVDDAIVVVEAVEHYIEKGLAPRAATIKAMEEVSGPIIAVGFVLTAVFVPCNFIPGIVGQFFRQFALTIAISTIISTINSLTLSPALAALLLTPKHERRDVLSRLLDFSLGWFFRLFERGFRTSQTVYTRVVGMSLRVVALVLFIYGGLIALTYWEYQRLPTGFIPAQDKGYFLASIQLPDSASAERTLEVMAQMEQIGKSIDGIKNVNSVAGNSFVMTAYGSHFGSMFIILKGFDYRSKDPSMSGEALLAKLRARCAKEIPDAQILIFPAPAVSGLGRAGGFKLMIEDRGEVGMRTLQAVTDSIVERGNKQPGLNALNTVFKLNSPQLFIDIDRKKCMTQRVDLRAVFDVLEGYFGSSYANDFNLFSRTWQVMVQADAPFRNDLEDMLKLKVRNNAGQMVPLSSVASVRPGYAPLVLTRYNMYPAAPITGNFAPGYSSGNAMAITERMCDQELPPSMAYEWSELAYLERTDQLVKLPSVLKGYSWSEWLKNSLTSTGLIVCGSVMFVFLVLAALYESWRLPLAVILVVPMCVLGSLTGVTFASLDVNIFTQVGFVVLIGLACKNAILIVEFAKMRRDEGVDRRAATLEACQLRYRPILMTSFAFILGVLPLVAATGAGAEMRQALGTAVFSGMIAVTLFGIFLTPVFFFLIDDVKSSARQSWELILLPLDRERLWKPALRLTVSNAIGRRIGRLGAWGAAWFRRQPR